MTPPRSPSRAPPPGGAASPPAKPAPRRLLAAPALSLSLQFGDASHRALLPRHKVARWMRAALEAPAEIAVRIVDAEHGQALNRDYRGRDYATNVLTFAYGDDEGGDRKRAARGPVVHADLVLCAPVVEREAREQGRPVQAHYAHLLVHGTLHAQGYDHERVRDARVMERRETEILAALGFPDPYAD